MGFSFLRSADRAQRVDGGDAADRPGGKTGLENFSVGPDGEVGRVNNAAAFFPVCADLVGIFGNFEAVADGKRRAGFFRHLLGLIERIDGESDDLGILALEFVNMRLIVGNLPDAVRSPDSAIENDDGVFALEIGGNI